MWLRSAALELAFSVEILLAGAVTTVSLLCSPWDFNDGGVLIFSYRDLLVRDFPYAPRQST